jgi:antitoxin component of MazEF toxin-antitoxin module
MAEAIGKVRRIGGSLMVTIPSEIAAVEGIQEGNTVR